MKRVYSRLTLLLILCLLPIPTLSVTWIPEVKGAEQVFFEENFENYNVGTFPSSGGWELWYNGAGTELQIIVDNVSVSPTKSLKLLGVNYWAGFAAKRFTSNSSTIGFEVAVRVEETNGQPRDDARVAFTTKVSSSISREYAPVTFQDSGVITSGGQVLQSYVADKWYKIKVIMNRDKEACSVWVDGELKGENLAVTTTSGNITDYPSYEIEAFSVSQCYNSVTAYFDDVKVFEVAENLEENGNFTLEPHPHKLPENGIWVAFLIDYRWFSIRLLYDNASKTYSVYAKELFVGDSTTDKGELVAENMRGPTVSSDGTFDPLEIMPLFEMREYYNLVIVYYDGVEVLAVAAENPLSSVIKVLSPQNTTYNSAEVPLEYKVNVVGYIATYSLDGQANQTTRGNTVLTGLSEGPHSIVVYIESPFRNIIASNTIYFTVASARGISILSPQNKTYNTADIPLTLTKNETCYYTAYSLDGQLHTDTENTILTGLSEGAHQLTVYGNYTDSHMGESATVWFSVDTTPPKITDVYQAPISINRTLEGGVEATVTDSVSEEATMKYSDDNGTGVTAEMTELEGGVRDGDTPAFPNGTNVTDTHIAEDEAEKIITTKEQYGHQKQCKVLQDFPSWIIPPLLLIVTASALVVRKRISTKVLTKIYNRVHQLLT